MSVGKTETIISKKDTQKTSDAQPAFATTARRASVQYRIWKTETEKQAQSKIQISVFKRKRFISSCRISICRSGCKRLRIFSRRSGSMAARSRTNLSRLLYLEYLLQPMPTAMRAEMIQTVMSVPETIRKTSNAQRPTSNIKFNLSARQSLSEHAGFATFGVDCVFLFANRNGVREALASVLLSLDYYTDRSRFPFRAVARLRRWAAENYPPKL